MNITTSMITVDATDFIIMIVIITLSPKRVRVHRLPRPHTETGARIIKGNSDCGVCIARHRRKGGTHIQAHVHPLT